MTQRSEQAKLEITSKTTSEGREMDWEQIKADFDLEDHELEYWQEYVEALD